MPPPAHRGRRIRRQAVDETKRVLIAAIADHGYSGDLVFCAGVTGIKNNRCTRFRERLFYAWVGFLFQCLVDVHQCGWSRAT